MPLALELGDAMRSWCNPFPEDSSSSLFNLELYEAALDGYDLVGSPAGLDESILPATLADLCRDWRVDFCRMSSMNLTLAGMTQTMKVRRRTIWQEPRPKFWLPKV